eukprot:2168295-Amphidinium_carterae.1
MLSKRSVQPNKAVYSFNQWFIDAEPSADWSQPTRLNAAMRIAVVDPIDMQTNQLGSFAVSPRAAQSGVVERNEDGH